MSVQGNPKEKVWYVNDKVSTSAHCRVKRKVLYGIELYHNQFQRQQQYAMIQSEYLRSDLESHERRWRESNNRQ